MSSSLTDRAASVAASVARLRQDVPAIEWRTGQLLAQIADLAGVVQELAAAPHKQTSPAIRTAANDHGDRSKELQRLAFLACRALPGNLQGRGRDDEIARILTKWGVTATEIIELGYQERQG